MLKLIGIGSQGLSWEGICLRIYDSCTGWLLSKFHVADADPMLLMLFKKIPIVVCMYVCDNYYHHHRLANVPKCDEGVHIKLILWLELLLSCLMFANMLELDLELFWGFKFFSCLSFGFWYIVPYLLMFTIHHSQLSTIMNSIHISMSRCLLWHASRVTRWHAGGIFDYRNPRLRIICTISRPLN